MKPSLPIYAFILLLLSFLTASASQSPSWTNYQSASPNDGNLRLRALWYRTSPAYDILTEGGTLKRSKDTGSTYEFCVLIENIGKEELVVPSWTKDGMPPRVIPFRENVIVPYIIKSDDAFGFLRYVDSPATFRPVKLKPGEATRLPIYYRIVKQGESLPPHWFYYAVEESLAKRYGWWSGELACKGEEFHPDDNPSSARPEPPSPKGSGEPSATK